MLIAGGVLAATGAYLFVYNIARTLGGRPAARAAQLETARRGLQVLDHE